MGAVKANRSEEHSVMIAKRTSCSWFDKDAQEAATLWGSGILGRSCPGYVRHWQSSSIPIRLQPCDCSGAFGGSRCLPEARVFSWRVESAGPTHAFSFFSLPSVPGGSASDGFFPGVCRVDVWSRSSQGDDGRLALTRTLSDMRTYETAHGVSDTLTMGFVRLQ